MAHKITCVECNSTDYSNMKLVRGETIYPHRQDLWNLRFWICQCGAYVGCHKNGDGKQPLGAAAGAETRRLRSKCHALFDPMWQSKDPSVRIFRSRNSAYAWISQMMRVEQAHFSWMGAADLNRALAILERVHNDHSEAGA